MRLRGWKGNIRWSLNPAHSRNTIGLQMKAKRELPIMECESQKQWDAWFEEHHGEPGVWLKLAKKGSGRKTVTYAEALETALTYGWIDSQLTAFDDEFYLQKFTPRGRRSVWSKANWDKALDLIAAGKMKPSGMRQVEIARANGEWDRLTDRRRI